MSRLDKGVCGRRWMRWQVGLKIDEECYSISIRFILKLVYLTSFCHIEHVKEFSSGRPP